MALNWEADRKRRIFLDTIRMIADTISPNMSNDEIDASATIIKFLRGRLIELDRESAEIAMQAYGKVAERAMRAA